MSFAAENPYALAPLCVAQADPATGQHLRAYIFLGAVPRAVLEAARRGRPRTGADPRRPEWSAADGATLRDYYGADWRDHLTGADPPTPDPLAADRARGTHTFISAAFYGGALRGHGRSLGASVSGGAALDLDFGDLGELDDLGEGEAPPPSAGRRGDAGGGPLPSFEARAGPPVYTDQAVYPEDTVYDLRQKLALASGVPLYRQHLFYYANGEGPSWPYQVTLDGAPVALDWRALAGAAPARAPGAQDEEASGEASAHIAGVAVDRRLEERREGLRVAALDTFTLLGPAPGVRVTRAYYVDLYAVLPPLGAPGRPLDNLAAALRDRYQFDLLYYGGLLRYWPQLSPDACSLALAEPARVGAVYPALDPDQAGLRARYAAEREVADAARRWRGEAHRPAAKGGRAATAVTAATIRVAPRAARMRVAVRNVFDWVPTGPACSAVAARFELDAALLSEGAYAGFAGFAAGPGGGQSPASPAALGAATKGGPVQVTAVKRHASSYGPGSAGAVGAFAARAPRRDTVAFALARAGGGGDEQWLAGARAVPYAYLTVRADGHYEARADWREDDRVGFGEVAEELAGVVAPTVAAINAMGAAAFPIGGALGALSGREALGSEAAPGAGAGAPGAGAGAGGAALGAITASAFWPHALTAAEFRDLKEGFRLYERAGVVSIRGLQQAGAYAFAFRKGVVAYDPRLAERATDPRRGAPAPAPGGPPGDAAAAVEAGQQAPSTPGGGGNQYAWLTEPAAAARWAAAFQGRTVRIHHRATDLRVEVVGADDLSEFGLIRRYVFSFLDGLAARGARSSRPERGARPQGRPAPAPARRAAPGPRPERGGPGAPSREAGPPGDAPARRLRRLQERDPNLFDLKKYDQGATVYSVLCQAGRQPHVYNEAEARGLAPRRRAALVRYWNFTDGEPAYYECPDPKYPHLSFRAGQHPLGHCLPCCKKTRPAAGSRAALVNEGCLARRAYEGAPGEAETALSRHVLTYGKAVPPGRLADPPREVSEGLFLDALPPPYRLQLVGVEQAAPAVPAAGYAYALAYALGLGEATADEVLAELAALAGELAGTYCFLGGGQGALFPSAGALADALLGAFVRRDPALSPFGPGGAAAEAWPAILADLARHAFGAEVVLLADPDGSGAVTLEAAPAAAAAIVGFEPALPPQGGPAPGASRPPRLALLVAGPMGTYPLAALNPRFYLRVPPGDRWMAARRTFELERGPAEADEIVEDRVAAAVRDALLSSGARGGPARARALALVPSGLPDLPAVERYARSPGASFAVRARLADLRGLCYGVMLERGGARRRGGEAGPEGAAGGESVYFPVRYSALPAGGAPVVYGPRPAAALPPAALAAALAEFNAAAAQPGLPGACAPIAQASALVDAAGRAIGFTHAVGGEALCFYHDPVERGLAEALWAPRGQAQSAPETVFPYDSRLVDLAIVAAARSSGRGLGAAGDGGAEGDGDREGAAAVAALAAGARWRNGLYRLFLAEFAAALRADRNEPLREKLLAAVRGTRFEVPKAVAALRRRLYELLEGHPDDLRTVREAVARAFKASPQDPRSAAAAAIEATTFGFDRHTLARLRSLGSHGETAAAIRALMAPHITTERPDPGAQGPDGGETLGASLPNVYVACADAGPASLQGFGRGLSKATPEAPQCVGRRLYVPAERLDDMYDILAADARNPGKVGLLASVSAGVFDATSFIRRPGEHLTVTIGP